MGSQSLSGSSYWHAPPGPSCLAFPDETTAAPIRSSQSLTPTRRKARVLFARSIWPQAILAFSEFHREQPRPPSREEKGTQEGSYLPTYLGTQSEVRSNHAGRSNLNLLAQSKDGSESRFVTLTSPSRFTFFALSPSNCTHTHVYAGIWLLMYTIHHPCPALPCPAPLAVTTLSSLVPPIALWLLLALLCVKCARRPELSSFWLPYQSRLGQQLVGPALFY